MPARVKKIRHDDETRAKIQAAQIINRLHACIMGKVTLTSAQVSAAKTLLGKVLPDLQSVEHSGETTKRIVSAVPLTKDQWAAQHADRTH
jgi:hypothetical protein